MKWMDYIIPEGVGSGLKWVNVPSTSKGKFLITRTGTNVAFKYYQENTWYTIYLVKNIDKPVSILLGCSISETYHLFSAIYLRCIEDGSQRTRLSISDRL